MLGEVAEEVGGKLTERWGAVVAPAVLFWSAGLGAWVATHGRCVLKDISGWTAGEQLALGIGAGAVVLASAVVVWAFETPVLQALEGYLPAWIPFVRWKQRRMDQRIARMFDRQQELHLQGSASAERTALDAWLRHVPTDIAHRMPTRLGNVLRAAERRPFDKYGLDAVTCWSRLWLVMPADSRAEIESARASLDLGVRLLIWSALFAIWSVWWPWAVLAGAIGIWISYRWALRGAMTYGDLVEAAYDVHRFELYRALRFPLPRNTEDEPTDGKRLTQYLALGVTSQPVDLEP